jgi:hypothetical protein
MTAPKTPKIANAQRDGNENGGDPANVKAAESVRHRGKHEAQQNSNRHRDEHFPTEVKPRDNGDANNDCVGRLSASPEVRAGTAERVSYLALVSIRHELYLSGRKGDQDLAALAEVESPKLGGTRHSEVSAGPDRRAPGRFVVLAIDR